MIQLQSQLPQWATQAPWAVKQLADLASIPNVTGNRTDLERNAASIVALYAELGVELHTDGQFGAGPLIFGRLEVSPDAPTIGIYVHYDGQPVGEPDWETEPFDPVFKLDGQAIPIDDAINDPNGINPDLRLYGRGTADDRAPVIAIAAALRALEGTKPAVNLVFCFEGEEESGSPNLAAYLAANRDHLQADHWWICDGPVHQSGLPQVVCGVRGYAGFELTVYGPESELHSGHYGNWVPNPAQLLVEVLAQCKKDGRIEIEGFDACATPITSGDREAIARLPGVDAEILDRIGVAMPEREQPLFESVLSSSFNIRGLHAGTVGPNTRNIIPSTAQASVDMRLAPGVEPEVALDELVSYLESLGYTVIDREPTPEERRTHPRLAKIDRKPAYQGMRVPADSPIVVNTAKILESAAGVEPVILPSLGGSVPFHHLTETLAVEAVLVPIANHDNNQHAANENLRLGHLGYGFDLFTALIAP